MALMFRLLLRGEVVIRMAAEKGVVTLVVTRDPYFILTGFVLWSRAVSSQFDLNIVFVAIAFHCLSSSTFLYSATHSARYFPFDDSRYQSLTINVRENYTCDYRSTSTNRYQLCTSHR